MPDPKDINAITAAFSQHAQTYDQFAHVQNNAARLLDQQIASFVGREIPTIKKAVDLGCGTGQFSEYLFERFTNAQFQLCDISFAMLEQARDRFCEQARASSITYLQGDAETLKFEPAVDIIASNFCAQWFTNPAQALAHHSSQSRYVAWTTLVAGTFSTWIDAHEQHAIDHGIRAFPTLATLQQAVDEIAPSRSLIIPHREILHFPNARMFLRELRAIGATTPRSDYRKNNLLPIIRSFEDGFDAEYEIAIILMEKQCTIF